MRLTIADIARRARVSTAAVSYALNGRPGVSDGTRARILAIADSAGWRPSSAARSLQSARTNALGLLSVGPEPADADSSHFIAQFLLGVQDELATSDVLLVLHSAPDVDAANRIYQRWRAEHRVDGVMVLNPLARDPRLPVLRELEMPAVVVGDTRRSSGLPSVWTDDRRAACLAVEHLAGIGHRRIARVGICPQYLHSQIRGRAFAWAMRRAGLEPDLSVCSDVPAREEIVQDMLASADAPTAVIFEDPNVAVRTTMALLKTGLAIPADLSVIAWDGSAPCRLVQPALTTLERDVRRYGRLVARRLVAAVEGETTGHVRGTVTELVVRDSTTSPRNRPKY